MNVEKIRQFWADMGGASVLRPETLTLIYNGSQLTLHVELFMGSLTCPDVHEFLDIWDGGPINDATFYGDFEAVELLSEDEIETVESYGG